MNLADSIRSRLDAEIDKPKTHKAVVAYSDGRVFELPQPSFRQASNYAERERSRMGRDLISIDRTHTVRIVSVEVVAL